MPPKRVATVDATPAAAAAAQTAPKKAAAKKAPAKKAAPKLKGKADVKKKARAESDDDDDENESEDARSEDEDDEPAPKKKSAAPKKQHKPEDNSDVSGKSQGAVKADDAKAAGNGGKKVDECVPASAAAAAAPDARVGHAPIYVSGVASTKVTMKLSLRQFALTQAIIDKINNMVESMYRARCLQSQLLERIYRKLAEVLLFAEQGIVHAELSPSISREVTAERICNSIRAILFNKTMSRQTLCCCGNGASDGALIEDVLVRAFVDELMQDIKNALADTKGMGRIVTNVAETMVLPNIRANLTSHFTPRLQKWLAAVIFEDVPLKKDAAKYASDVIEAMRNRELDDDVPVEPVLPEKLTAAAKNASKEAQGQG